MERGRFCAGKARDTENQTFASLSPSAFDTFGAFLSAASILFASRNITAPSSITSCRRQERLISQLGSKFKHSTIMTLSGVVTCFSYNCKLQTISVIGEVLKIWFSGFSGSVVQTHQDCSEGCYSWSGCTLVSLAKTERKNNNSKKART